MLAPRHGMCAIWAWIRQIWRYAKAQGFTVVSEDEDCLHLAKRDTGGEPALVWVRLPNRRKAELLASFRAVLP